VFYIGIGGKNLMAVKDIFKVSRKTFFDPLAWIDYNWLKILNKTIYAQLAALFKIPKPLRTETFEQAVQRFDLQESDIKQIEQDYRSFAILFAAFGIAIFVFGFYLFFHHGTFHGWIIAMAVAALSFSQAFKYDFWAFQIKQRKLGCTLKDWKKARLG
jgi:intracellular multiplication protein IcmV